MKHLLPPAPVDRGFGSTQLYNVLVELNSQYMNCCKATVCISHRQMLNGPHKLYNIVNVSCGHLCVAFPIIHEGQVSTITIVILILLDNGMSAYYSRWKSHKMFCQHVQLYGI